MHMVKMSWRLCQKLPGLLVHLLQLELLSMLRHLEREQTCLKLSWSFYHDLARMSWNRMKQVFLKCAVEGSWVGLFFLAAGQGACDSYTWARPEHGCWTYGQKCRCITLVYIFKLLLKDRANIYWRWIKGVAQNPGTFCRSKVPVPLSIAPLRLLCFSMQQQQAPSRTSIWHCQHIWCLMTGTKLGPVYSPFGKTACGFVNEEHLKLEIQGAREQGSKSIYVQTISIFSSFWHCGLPLPRYQISISRSLDILV